MNAEFFKDLDIDEYHKRTDVLSKSMLSEFADCPARFKHRYIDNKPKLKTKSLRIGSAVHTLALEPEKWVGNYHIMPATYYDKDGAEKPWRNDKRMQVYKDEMAAAGYDVVIGEDKEVLFEERINSKIVLGKDEFIMVEKMAEALAKSPEAIMLLKAPGYVEASIFFDYVVKGEDGEPLLNPDGSPVTYRMRTRPDQMRNDRINNDLKTARSVKPAMFFKDAFDLHYDLSAAITHAGYEALHGEEPDDYVFIAVESTEPYLISCFSSATPMEEMGGITYLDYGKQHLAAVMREYHKCKVSGVWPAYQTGIKAMQIPGWALKNFMEKGF